MNQKEVKIIGLSLNQSLGIVNACEVKFDKNNKLIIIKGASGNGKSTFQDAIQIGVHGTKAMPDNQKYGEIDLELQLTDGELPVFVGRRTKGKTIVSTLYIKNFDGKIDREPVIDGIKATPKKYFEHLETALTWRMPELTSDNPAVQKKVLLSMYQLQLKDVGVIFDKKHPEYESSIRGKIDAAVLIRDEKDFLRKQKGGIADDLKAQGHDPDRPGSCPDAVNVEVIEAEIKELERLQTIAIAEPEAQKNTKLAEIKADAMGVTNKCLAYNSELKGGYDTEKYEYNQYEKTQQNYDNALSQLAESMQFLGVYEKYWDSVHGDVIFPKKISEPTKPAYINFDDNNNVTDEDVHKLDDTGKELIKNIDQLRQQYANTASQEATTDTSKYQEKIAIQEKNKLDALEINKIVDAIDSFHQWRAANADVVRLKGEYVKLLTQINTGVEGLEIQTPKTEKEDKDNVKVSDDIFLMYDGSYDIPYFQPKEKRPVMRKLSSYSGTQKPVICLLIQNYLLSQKPKALRYMYIDDVPMDRQVRALLERMTEELNLTTFLNITGDFEKNTLQDGEILIEGGEVFFK